MSPREVLDALAGGLVVSCQAKAGTPLDEPGIIARLARCAELGGACGVRIDSPANIRAVSEAVGLPILGLFKSQGEYRPVITTTFERARAIADAGASLLAIEVSPDSPDGAQIIARVRAELGVGVLADVACLADGERAVAAGASAVATTLSGYLKGDAPGDEPDLDLVRALCGLGVPVVAEGRYRTRDQIVAGFSAGAHAVVVGSAITDPVATTRWFVRGTPGSGSP